MSKEIKIVWQKWFDPLGQDDLENLSDDTENTLEPEYYEEEIEQEIPEEEETHFYRTPTKVIMTPMGMIPYNENTASNKIFNFWMGHTNFDINAHICLLLEQQQGVETLDIFTRYRFRIGIGKLFDAKTVMYEINQKVYDFVESNM